MPLLAFDRVHDNAAAIDMTIVNDQTNDFRLLTYYIKKEHQIRQLEDVGFSGVEMVSLDGSFIDLNEPCEDHWIYYIARKR
jgi:hypothetical protein